MERPPDGSSVERGGVEAVVAEFTRPGDPVPQVVVLESAGKQRPLAVARFPLLGGPVWRWRLLASLYEAVAAWPPELRVSADLLREAPEPVMRALVAHELGHLREAHRLRDVMANMVAKVGLSTPVVVVYSLLTVASAVFFPSPWTMWAVSLILVLGCPTAIVVLWHFREKRQEEFRADRCGADLAGAAQMAAGLEWLEAWQGRPGWLANLMPTVLSTHPRTADRIRRIRSV